MRGTRIHVALALILVLAGCAMPQPPVSHAPTEVVQSGALQGESDQGEAEPTPEVIAPITLTGSLLPERLLENGVLEVGTRDAPHTFLLITEHHCRYCKDFLTDLIPAILLKHIERGDLRLSIAIMPLKKYAGSADGATALYCAGAQGKGWPMHQWLFTQETMDKKTLLAGAKALALDATTLEACLSDPQKASMLEEQQAWLRNLHVSLVPTYFIDGEKFTGLPYAADLDGQLLDALER